MASPAELGAAAPVRAASLRLGSDAWNAVARRLAVFLPKWAKFLGGTALSAGDANAVNVAGVQ